jgi:hypothetical protein
MTMIYDYPLALLALTARVVYDLINPHKVNEKPMGGSGDSRREKSVNYRHHWPRWFLPY